MVPAIAIKQRRCHDTNCSTAMTRTITLPSQVQHRHRYSVTTLHAIAPPSLQRRSVTHYNTAITTAS